MVFVLDSSGSVGSANFKMVKDFVEDVVKGYDIGLDKTRIGVIKYSTSVVREFDLDTYNSKEKVLQAVDRIVYSVSVYVQNVPLMLHTNSIVFFLEGERNILYSYQFGLEFRNKNI